MGAQAVAVIANTKAIENSANILLVEHSRSFPSEGIWPVPHADRRVWKLLYVGLKSAQSIGCVINSVKQPIRQYHGLVCRNRGSVEGGLRISPSSTV
jgi:hypothetical protein